MQMNKNSGVHFRPMWSFIYTCFGFTLGWVAGWRGGATGRV